MGEPLQEKEKNDKKNNNKILQYNKNNGL